MRYVVALFRKFHNAPEVFSMPYPEIVMAQIGKWNILNAAKDFSEVGTKAA
jgi:hypothetical protein